MIFRHRRVATRKLGELVKPVSGGKGAELLAVTVPASGGTISVS